MTPIFVLAWVFVAVYATDDSGDVTGYHLHHSWTFEECETMREQFIDAPYLSRCEPIVAVATP